MALSPLLMLALPHLMRPPQNNPQLCGAMVPNAPPAICPLATPHAPAEKPTGSLPIGAARSLGWVKTFPAGRLLRSFRPPRPRLGVESQRYAGLVALPLDDVRQLAFGDHGVRALHDHAERRVRGLLARAAVDQPDQFTAGNLLALA